MALNYGLQGAMKTLGMGVPGETPQKREEYDRYVQATQQAAMGRMPQVPQASNVGEGMNAMAQALAYRSKNGATRPQAPQGADPWAGLRQDNPFSAGLLKLFSGG